MLFLKKELSTLILKWSLLRQNSSKWRRTSRWSWARPLLLLLKPKTPALPQTKRAGRSRSRMRPRLGMLRNMKKILTLCRMTLTVRHSRVRNSLLRTWLRKSICTKAARIRIVRRKVLLNRQAFLTARTPVARSWQTKIQLKRPPRCSTTIKCLIGSLEC